MACIRKRRGNHVVDWRDAWGRRHWASFKTRREAKAKLGEVLRAAHQTSRPVVDPTITVLRYAERWEKTVAATAKGRTAETYGRVLRLHILPRLGPTRGAAVHRAQIKALLVEQLATRARGTVKLTLAVLRALLSAAVDDGIILANPADRLGRALKLARPAVAEQEEIKAMSRPQVAAF